MEKTTDYIGQLIFENEDLQFIQTAEGRVVPCTTHAKTVLLCPDIGIDCIYNRWIASCDGLGWELYFGEAFFGVCFVGIVAMLNQLQAVQAFCLLVFGLFMAASLILSENSVLSGVFPLSTSKAVNPWSTLNGC